MRLEALAAVGLGGAFGSILRYAVAGAMLQRFGPGFPWGTLLVNVSGSLAIGVVAELAQTRVLGISSLVRLFLMVGVLGGYTTFSTFSLDGWTLVSERALLPAFAYTIGSVVLGGLAAYVGIVAVRLLSAQP